MPDDLIVRGLVLVLLDEIGRTGKCDLADVFLDFVCRHTKTVIGKCQGLSLRVYGDADLCLEISWERVLAHHV